MAAFLNTRSSTVHGWAQSRSPSAEYILPICEFLGVTPEYLLSGKDPEPVTEESLLEPTELELLGIYRHLDRDGKRILEGKALDLRDTHSVPDEIDEEISQAK